MQVNLEVDDAVGLDRVGQALDPDLAARLAMDLVLHMREGLVGDQDAAGRRLVLEPRGEVHGAADDGVVHAVLAAEIADRAIAGVDADTAAQRRSLMFLDVARLHYSDLGILDPLWLDNHL